ncbi:paraneoplastic antigen Ma1 homolog [Pholidichthys leucotaenia]
MEKAELMLALKSWCHGEGLDETHALMVIIPEEVEISERNPSNYQAFRTCACAWKEFQPKTKQTNGLLQKYRDCQGRELCPQVVSSDGGEAWPIIIIGGSPAATEEFNSKLEGPLQAEGKTMEDVKSLFPSAPPPTNSTESILRAIGELLDKTIKPADGASYYWLCKFSGTLPTPSGEEPLDQWLEQGWLTVEETEYSDREKRHRLIGSLKGPTLGIIKAVQCSNPDANPKECLEALKSAFGSAE